MVETQEQTETQTQTKEQTCLKRYAWGWQEAQTWILTKKKKGFMPKGCRLLMIVYCEQTDEDFFFQSTYPQKGDICQDEDYMRLKILSTEVL